MQETLKIFESFMYFLLLFAFANILSGLFFRKKLKNQKLSYFLEMNFFWNIVNLFIAILALYQNSKIKNATSNLIAEYIQTSKNVVYFNIYLDIFYIFVALFIFYLGYKKSSQRLKGYSFSIIFQGLFLFILDLAIYIQIVARGF